MTMILAASTRALETIEPSAPVAPLPRAGQGPGRRASRGQSAVIVAVVLPFLMAFALLVVEVAERWLEVAMVEDALQQATRSTVQLLDYRALAAGEAGLRASAPCYAVTWREPSACRQLLTVARSFLVANLAGVRGLAESPATLADRVRWTVLPVGGTCPYANTRLPALTEPTPLLCAEVRPLMRGVVGWGDYRPLILAADTLDPIVASR